jgi:CUE domain
VFGEGGESPPSSSAVLENGRGGGSPGPAGEREEEAAVRLAKAEIERADRAEREQRGQTLEMLTQMFPGTTHNKNHGLIGDLDSEVVEAVIVAKEGRIGVCIDVCLEMSSGIETPANDSKTDLSAETKDVGSTVDDGKESVETTDLLGLGMSQLSLDSGDRQREASAGEPVNLLD